MSVVTMKEWLQNELYTELIQMPLWTLSAFGDLKEGLRLDPDNPRYRLITYLVCNHIGKCPNHVYDTVYRNNWQTLDFVEPIKAALKRSEEIVNKK